MLDFSPRSLSVGSRRFATLLLLETEWMVGSWSGVFLGVIYFLGVLASGVQPQE